MYTVKGTGGNTMKINWKRLFTQIAIPLITGGVAGFLSGGGMEAFAAAEKPPLSPPGWLFPVVWTILYVLMGIAAYLILQESEQTQEGTKALTVYWFQLIVNFLWPIFFFNFGWYLFSFFWLLLLWGLIIWMIVLFYRIYKPAAYLLIPYLVWVTFAAYLNLGIWWLNR